MNRLLNVVSGISVLLGLLVLISMRRAHIRVEYSVSWLAAAGLLFLLSMDERLLLWIGGAIGIESGPLVLLVLASAVFLAVFFVFSVRLSEMRDANIQLTQRLAILEYKVRNLHEKQES